MIDAGTENDGGKWLVLFFYPDDLTAICPAEIVSFSGRYDEFARLNAEVIGCSVDLFSNHWMWLASPRERGLFIIDPKGAVRFATVTDTNIGRTIDEALRMLEALQRGGLCSVDWKPGFGSASSA